MILLSTKFDICVGISLSSSSHETQSCLIFFCRFEIIRLNEGSKSAYIVCLWNNQYWVAAAMVACNWNSELYEILPCIWYYGVIYIDFPPIMNQPKLKPKLWFKLNMFQGNGTKWKFLENKFRIDYIHTHTHILE